MTDDMQTELDLFKRGIFGPDDMIKKRIGGGMKTLADFPSLLKLLPIDCITEMEDFLYAFPFTEYGWSKLPTARAETCWKDYPNGLDLNRGHAVYSDDWRRTHQEDRSVIEALRRIVHQHLSESTS